MPFDRPGLTMRPIEADELPAFGAFIQGVFLSDVHDDEIELDRRLVEPARTLAVFDTSGSGAPISNRSTPVASTAIFSRELTVPGGPIPAAAVTAVAVAPTHRRQGLLAAMMRRQLDELHDTSQEAVAILWASEAAIYGRFGYGAACRANHLDIASRQTRVRSEFGRSGQVTVCPADEAAPFLRAVYEQVRHLRAGHLDRKGPWWDARLFDPQWRRDGASSLRFAVHHVGPPSSSGDAYAVYSVKGTWDATGPQGVVSIREVQASTPAGAVAIWAFLLEMDLVSHVRWDRAATDEPVQYLVDNPRAIRQTSVDSLWVRLVDVDRALAARVYAAPVDVVIEVSDPFCAWNVGRYRLTGDQTGAHCTPTSSDADLAVSVGALGAAYLGGTSLTSLAAAGLVTERRPGALAAASSAFFAARPPSCPEVF